MRKYIVRHKETGEIAQWFDLDKKESQKVFPTSVAADYLRDYMNLCVYGKPVFETVLAS